MGYFMSHKLIDSFGRTINNLRISVTDQCNFRCIYCMPEEGMVFMPRSEILTFEEITRFATISSQLGINKLRLTGGEPTLRKDLPVLVRMLTDIPGIGATRARLLLREFGSVKGVRSASDGALTRLIGPKAAREVRAHLMPPGERLPE